MTPLTQSETTGIKERSSFLIWPLLGLGMLAFIILWQRGGSSMLALTAGIFLIGVLVSLKGMQHYFLPPIHFETWTSALSSYSGGIFYRMVLIIQQSSTLISLAMKYFFPVSMVITMILLNKHRVGSSYYLKQILEPLLTFAVIILTFNILHLVFRTLFSGILFQDMLTVGQNTIYIDSLSAVFATITILILCIVYIKHVSKKVMKYSQKSSKYIMSMVLFVTMVGVCFQLIDAEIIQPVAGTLNTVISICIMAVIMVSGMLLLLKLNELHIMNNKGLSILLLVAVVPVLIEILEAVGAVLLTSMPLFVPGGIGVLSIVVAVALLNPIQKKIVIVFNFLKMPKLKSVESSVAETLEGLIDVKTIKEKHEMVKSLLQDKMKIPEFAYYYRNTKGEMRLLIELLPGELPDSISISKELWSVLGELDGYIDNENLEYSWKYVFEKYEIERILSKTRSRYLLPVSLGNKLMGILLFPDSVSELLQGKEPFAELIKEVVLHASF